MGKLSVVATPIGNLGDITLRALETLKVCDVIYAEDTRVIAKLLAKFEIKKPLTRLDAVTEAKKAEEVVARLIAGEHIVLVSDAGTPGISDPGARLVSLLRERGITAIEAIPGPSALTALLSIAGVDTSGGFVFYGFLPHKKGRLTMLKKVGEMVRADLPVVLYESPHRIRKLLEALQESGVARVVVGRELTKMHEEVVTGVPAEVAAHFAAHPDTVRGEFVVIATS